MDTYAFEWVFIAVIVAPLIGTLSLQVYYYLQPKPDESQSPWNIYLNSQR